MKLRGFRDISPAPARRDWRLVDALRPMRLSAGHRGQPYVALVHALMDVKPGSSK